MVWPFLQQCGRLGVYLLNGLLIDETNSKTDSSQIEGVQVPETGKRN